MCPNRANEIKHVLFIYISYGIFQHGRRGALSLCSTSIAVSTHRLSTVVMVWRRNKPGNQVALWKRRLCISLCCQGVDETLNPWEGGESIPGRPSESRDSRTQAQSWLLRVWRLHNNLVDSWYVPHVHFPSTCDLWNAGRAGGGASNKLTSLYTSQSSSDKRSDFR